MGLALGWIAVALAGVAGAPRAERGDVAIGYTVRIVETEGLGWREAVLTRLTPVTRQGAATVWTAPRDVVERLIKQSLKDRTAHVLQAPRIIAWSGSAAHVSTRANRQLVTQVAWNGDDQATEGKPETVRTGSVATMTGRRLDQGILVQLVLEDTEIRAVHRVSLRRSAEAKSSPEAKKAAYDAEECCESTTCCILTDEARKSRLKELMHQATSAYAQGKYVECETYAKKAMEIDPNERAASVLAFKAKIERRYRTDQQAVTTKKTPTPEGSCDELFEITCPAAAPCTSGTKDIALTKAAACATECEARGVAVEVPEIGSQEVAGEWLIPKDGLLLVSFGPHTIAGKDGKAVIRERLAIIEAEEAAGARIPQGSRTATPFMVPVPPVPEAVAPQPIPAPVAKLPMPVPGMPSRSIPQGVHADGTPAKLPPLPPDETEDSASESESSEPRPSPQTKKPRQPKPASDSGMSKAEYAPPRFPVIPSMFMPIPSVGLQFLVPIKPFSLRLPFNRKLEIEIYGRVVRDTTPADKSLE